MHKSRLCALVIDCHTDDLEGATRFWSEALGYDREANSDPEIADYAVLATPPTEVKLLLQRVEHPSRVHLDIETDDIDKEVARLEQLGAKQVGRVKRWVVMEAPSGHRFCVVRPQRPDFAENARQWPD